MDAGRTADRLEVASRVSSTAADSSLSAEPTTRAKDACALVLCMSSMLCRIPRTPCRTSSISYKRSSRERGHRGGGLASYCLPLWAGCSRGVFCAMLSLLLLLLLTVPLTVPLLLLLLLLLCCRCIHNENRPGLSIKRLRLSHSLRIITLL